MSVTTLNLDELNKTSLNTHPFPYLIVRNFINPEKLTEIRQAFPAIKFPGSIPLSEVKYNEVFAQLITDLQSDELRQAIAHKLDMNITDLPTMITLRGQCRTKDGRIHTDTVSKKVTALLYMNPCWEHSGGRLRILRNGKSLNDYVSEIPPLEGTLLLFKVTDNCWHGHYPYAGERKAIQLNYVSDQAAIKKHGLRHKLSSNLKKFKQLFKV